MVAIRYGMCISMLVFLMLSHSSAAHMVIREARESDLEAVLALDRAVSFEFFKPVYEAGYSDSYGKDAEAQLRQELADDVNVFRDSIQTHASRRLVIAEDIACKLPVGLIFFSKEHDVTILIDLLLVKKEYRGLGIGKKLVLAARDTFSDMHSMTVYPLRNANEATLKFYQKIGFQLVGPGPQEIVNSYGESKAKTHLHYVLACAF